MEQDLEAAAALIEEYEAETGQQVTFQFGHTPTTINDEIAELLHRLVVGDRRRRRRQARSRRTSSSPGPVRRPEFQAFLWRNHAGVGVDQQYFWWHSRRARTPTASCR